MPHPFDPFECTTRGGMLLSMAILRLIQVANNRKVASCSGCLSSEADDCHERNEWSKTNGHACQIIVISPQPLSRLKYTGSFRISFYWRYAAKQCHCSEEARHVKNPMASLKTDIMMPDRHCFSACREEAARSTSRRLCRRQRLSNLSKRLLPRA